MMEKKRTEDLMEILGLKESGLDGEDEWSEMVWACDDEG